MPVGLRIRPKASTSRLLQESSHSFVNEKLASESKQKDFATWESKTQKSIDVRSRLAQMDRIEALHNDALEARRVRLAQLLADEERQWEEEIAGLNETQAQRAERVAAAASDLRQRRERARQEQAEKLANRAFVANCDALRQANVNARSLQIAAEREKQMEWVEKKKALEEEEEAWYVEQQEKELRKEREQAERERRAARERQDDIRDTIAAQVACNAEQRARLAELQKEEEQLLHERMAAERRSLEERERARARQTLSMGLANRAENMQLQVERKKRAAEMRAEEKKALDALLEAVAAEKELDVQERRQRKTKMLEAKRLLEIQLNRAAESEADVERMWIEESERQWRKREAEWQAARNARDELVKRVFEERALQLQMRKQQIEREASEKIVEREALEFDLENYKAIEKARAASRREILDNNNAMLREQVEYRRLHGENSKLTKALELEAAKLAEQRYVERVTAELAKVDMKKPKQFAAVSTFNGTI